MRIATRPVSERAVQKVLLVDRLEQHDNGPLRHLVLERRYGEPTLAAARFVYVVTPQRWRTITAGFEPSNQVGEVVAQINCVLLRRLTVYSYRAVLACALVRILHPFHIEIMVQRGERHRWVLSRELGYPLLFR